MEPWPGPHTGTTAFFGVKIFKFSKISGMIDMMSPMKSANGEDMFLCLWAGPGLFKSTFFAIFNGQTLRRASGCSRSFLTWGGSYLELKLSIHILVRGFSALSIGRSCLFYLGVVKVEVIGFTPISAFDQWPRPWPLRGRKWDFFQYSCQSKVHRSYR